MLKVYYLLLLNCAVALLSIAKKPTSPLSSDTVLIYMQSKQQVRVPGVLLGGGATLNSSIQIVSGLLGGGNSQFTVRGLISEQWIVAQVHPWRLF